MIKVLFTDELIREHDVDELRDFIVDHDDKIIRYLGYDLQKYISFKALQERKGRLSANYGIKYPGENEIIGFYSLNVVSGFHYPLEGNSIVAIEISNLAKNMVYAPYWDNEETFSKVVFKELIWPKVVFLKRTFDAELLYVNCPSNPKSVSIFSRLEFDVPSDKSVMRNLQKQIYGPQSVFMGREI